MDQGNRKTHRTRLDKLNDLFEETKDRYIFDPLAKSVGFNKRRPTDYKLNKSVKLPKPLKSDAEFECELRRREYMASFKKYNKIQSDRYNKKNKRKKDSSCNNNIENTKRRKNHGKRVPINLNPQEKAGLKSLCQRVKSGELIITSTDKSSRFAVLNKDQYLKSGFVHTDKDQ